MLLDLKQPLKVGDKIPLTLTFQNAGSIGVSVDVEPMGSDDAQAMRTDMPACCHILIAGLACFAVTEASAHCVVGARFFPATLSVDDPCVADELSFPTVASFKNGDDPSTRELDIAAEFSKRITDNFGISLASAWTQLSPSGDSRVHGFQNLEASFKYQFLTTPAREFVMSGALEVEFAHTGSAVVGAESFSVYTPTLFVGQGFGGLPDDMRMARPFALTGQIGYSIPSKSSTTSVDADSGDATTELNPRFLTYGGSLQYSMPYLKSNVADLGLPDFFNRMIPIVEFQFQTPVANYRGSGIGTTGTVSPGVIWIGKYFQVGLEAIIPSIAPAAREWACWHSCTSTLTTCSRTVWANRFSAVMRALRCARAGSSAAR